MFRKSANKELVFAVCCLMGIASFAIPESYLCFRPDSGKSSYPWDTADKWYNTTQTGNPVNRLPTESDDVFLYSSKNDVSKNGKPMLVTNGINAVTRGLEICDQDFGKTYLIGITVQDGGTMTNHGNVVLGHSGNYTGGGYITVNQGGNWTAKEDFYLGVSKGTSYLKVDEGGYYACDGELLVGCKNGGSGIVTNEGTVSVKDMFAGNWGMGIVVNKGNLEIERKLTLGRNDGAFGHFVNERGATLTKKSASNPVYIGYANNSIGLFECNGDWELSNTDSIHVGYGDNSTGRLIIGDAATVSVKSAADSVRIGTNSLAYGSLELRGGTLSVAGSGGTGHSILLGSNGELTSGKIVGWGDICNNNDRYLRMRFFGQVVADGENYNRDLNFAAIRTIGSGDDVMNSCGTNGWYVANKGRLVYPRAQNCRGNNGKPSHPCVGDYPTRNEPTLINSFSYSLDVVPSVTYYNFAELYAPDRNDIPSGLPSDDNAMVVSVWRFGLSGESNTHEDPVPVAFNGMRLKFRYDWRGIPDRHRVVVYRHDGSADGAWQRVSARHEVSSEDNMVETAKFDSSEQVWNAGWFAVVTEERKGFIFRVR